VFTSFKYLLYVLVAYALDRLLGSVKLPYTTNFIDLLGCCVVPGFKVYLNYLPKESNTSIGVK
jgi:hypothetical protein